MASLTKQRQSALAEVVQRATGFSCQGSLGAFFDQYLISEALARKLQLYYQSDTGKSASENIQLKQLNAAIQYFNINFSETDARALFLGGEGKNENKSARQLRNGYVHSLSQTDREAIERNIKTLNKLLRNFITSIASGDAPKK